MCAPQWNRFDLNALVAACNTAAKRCVELARRFGDDVLVTTMDIMLQRNYDAMKHIIGMFIPEEPRVFEDYLCDDGMGMGPYKIKCRMWREARWPSLTSTAPTPGPELGEFFLNEDMFKMFFGSLHHQRGGPADRFQRRLLRPGGCAHPQGTLLKPNFPAALSGRTHALGRIFDLLGALLGMGAPEQMLNAAGFSDSPHLFYSGYDKKGEWFQLFQIGFGGIPGRPVGTAQTATPCGRASPTYPTSLSNPTSRCASSAMRPSPTPAAPACTGAATASAWSTAFSVTVKSVSTTSAG